MEELHLSNGSPRKVLTHLPRALWPWPACSLVSLPVHPALLPSWITPLLFARCVFLRLSQSIAGLKLSVCVLRSVQKCVQTCLPSKTRECL